jgi:hypothetical protein
MEAKRMAAIAALAIGLGAMGAGIPLPGAAASAKSSAEKTDKGRKVCRSLVPSGTRFSTRVCRTQAEWDEMQSKSQDSLLKQQRGPGSNYELEDPLGPR